jgi:GntR family transcriptional regulator
MMFHIRTDSGEPIYEQLIRQIKHSIMTGVLKTGDQLPTVRELAVQLVVNPNTVARAYRELEQAGLVESNTRRGTVVRRSIPGIIASERKRRLQPFIDQLITEALALNFSDTEVIDQVTENFKKYK